MFVSHSDLVAHVVHAKRLTSASTTATTEKVEGTADGDKFARWCGLRKKKGLQGAKQLSTFQDKAAQRSVHCRTR